MVSEEDQGAIVGSEHETGEIFGSYYFYECNKDTMKYKVAVYGNMQSSASLPSHGSVLLQAISQQVTGVNLKLDLRFN